MLWNGENGKTILFHNEMPYDVPSQSAWFSAAGINGWAAYKVGAGVQVHQGWGMGSYYFFNIGGMNTNINASHAFEVPAVAGVKLHDLLTVSLGGNGRSIILSTTSARPRRGLDRAGEPGQLSVGYCHVKPATEPFFNSEPPSCAGIDIRQRSSATRCGCTSASR